MNARELIEQLNEMPPGAPVMHIWDGAARTEIEHVWLSREGKVVTADSDEYVYETEDRPRDVPTTEEDLYWRTPK